MIVNVIDCINLLGVSLEHGAVGKTKAQEAAQEYPDAAFLMRA